MNITVMLQTREQFEALFPMMETAKKGSAEKQPKEEGCLEQGKAAKRKSGWKEWGECLIIDADLLLEETKIQDKLAAGRVRWGIKCPTILRKSDEKFLEKLRTMIEEKKPDMVYCATIDMLAWLRSISYEGQIAGEASLYAWNAEAVSFWGGELDRISIPLELSSREIRELCMAVQKIDQDSQNKKEQREPEHRAEESETKKREEDKTEERGEGETKKREEDKTQERQEGETQEGRSCLMHRLEAPVYGRTPFMVSTNCVKLSTGKCDKNRKKYAELTDRFGNTFPVYTNCAHCYNIIYNCLPTSYEEGLWMLAEDQIRAFRVEFTTESGREAVQVMQTFRRLLASELEREKARGADRNAGGRAEQESGKTRGTDRNAGRLAGQEGGKARGETQDAWQRRKQGAQKYRGEKASEQKKGETAGVETTQGRFRLGVE